MFKAITNNIPNFLTLMNLLSGIVAIIFSFQAFDVTGHMPGWQWAALSIGIASLFDFFDGAVARILNARSPIGKELDSLADLVSFGVAPSLLLLNILLKADAGPLAYAALFLPLMGAVRLAIFNIDATQATEFKGLPIPANAIFWIGFVAAMASGKLHIPGNIVVMLIGLMGILMVSRVRMFSLKFHNLKIRGNVLRYAIIIAAIILVSTLGLPGLTLTILAYLILSVIAIVIKYQ